MAAGAAAEVIAKHAGTIKGSDGESIPVDRAAPNAPSVIYDAVFIPGGKESVATLAQSGLSLHFINEAFAHHKTIGSAGEGVELLKKTSVGQSALSSASSNGKVAEAAGVITAADGASFGSFFNQFKEALAKHRHLGGFGGLLFRFDAVQQLLRVQSSGGGFFVFEDGEGWIAVALILLDAVCQTAHFRFRVFRFPQPQVNEVSR